MVNVGYGILCLPALAVLLYWTVSYVRRAWSIVTFPFAYDYGESPELDRAIAVAHGRSFYHFWNQPPYHMANYTPLFSILNGLFVAVLGPQYQSGRAIAWVSSLLFCAGLAWLAWRESRTLLAPAITTLLWFSSHDVWDWTPLGREDELAMLCSLVGLLIFYEGVVRKRDPEHGWWQSLFWFVAAIYVRQTTVEATFASGVYLLATRPRRGVAFLAIFGLAGATIFALLDIVTGGAFYLNVVTGNLNVFSWPRVLFLAAQFWRYGQGALLLATCSMVGQIVRRRHQLLVLWLLATFAVAITGGKDGAAENYQLLPWAATSLAAGVGVADLRELSLWLWKRRPIPSATSALAVALPVLVGLVLLLQAQLTFHLPYDGRWSPVTFERSSAHGIGRLLREWTETGWYRWVLPWEPPPAVLEKDSGLLYKPLAGPSDWQQQATLNRLVAATPGDVLDEDMTHLLLAGKRIYIQPFEFSEEARLGQWDQRPFVQSIADRYFGLVILTVRLRPGLRMQRFTRPMLAALGQDYCLSERVGRYFVYHPCHS